MVVKRFLAVFFPAAEFRVTTRITEVAGHHFKTEGKVLVEPGWLQVYGRDAEGADANLVPVQKDEKVKTDEIAAVALVTKPPARYSEATLLSAMEGAGKLVEDDELREAMAAKGLGTPATRAAIIEGLLGEKYLVREGRELIPTAKAFQLMTLLRAGVKELTAPDRRMGIQAVADGARQPRARSVHAGNRPHDAADREAREGIRFGHDPRRLRDARDAVPELRRPGEGKLPPLRVHEVRILDLEDPGQPAVRNRGSRGAAAREDDRPAVRLPQQDGPPFSAILKLSFDDETKNYKLEFDFGRTRAVRKAKRPTFPHRSRSARARSARAVCSSTG